MSVIEYNKENIISNVIVKAHSVINVDQLLCVSTEDHRRKVSCYSKKLLGLTAKNPEAVKFIQHGTRLY